MITCLETCQVVHNLWVALSAVFIVDLFKIGASSSNIGKTRLAFFCSSLANDNAFSSQSKPNTL